MKTRGPQLLVAFGVAAAGLLAEPAHSDQAMFRIQRRFLNGGASRTSPLEPSLGRPACGQGGSMGTPPTCAPLEVGTTAPVAGFVIPAKNFYYTFSGSYSTPPGYRSSTFISSHNGRGRFSPNNPYAAATYRRVYFRTTGDNAPPHEAAGDPLTPTTTFAGAFDFGRAGSMKIHPGPNRFGGTIQFLFGPDSRLEWAWYDFSYGYTRATGSFYCRMTAGSGPGARNGPLQACTSYGESKLGVIGSSGLVTRKLYTRMGIVPKKTDMGINDLTFRAYYLSTVAPWTTGSLTVQNPLNNALWTRGGMLLEKTVQGAGYNKSFSSPVTRTFSYTHHNTTPLGSTTTTTTQKQLKGITRITSMVRPRLRHTYLRSSEPTRAIETPFQSARIQGLRVYFLPEPSGMLLLGAGVLTLASLWHLRGR